MPLAGGIMQHGYQCGMVWGAALAAGAQAYRLFGTGPQAETMAIIGAQRATEAFRARENTIDCFDITELDLKSPPSKMMIQFLVKGKAVGCFRMAGGYAPVAFSDINAALSGERIEAPSAPVSCSAMLVKKLGASDMHAVIAAGLAGGIGLSGGACGAMGAAIWMIGMDTLREGAGKLDYKAPRALKAIDKFVKSSDYVFECSKIVGRKFESVADHANYLRGGGCSGILEVLGTT